MEEAANGRVQAEELLENESAILAQDSSSAVVDWMEPRMNRKVTERDMLAVNKVVEEAEGGAGNELQMGNDEEERRDWQQRWREEEEEEQTVMGWMGDPGSAPTTFDLDKGGDETRVSNSEISELNYIFNKTKLSPWNNNKSYETKNSFPNISKFLICQADEV